MNRALSLSKLLIYKGGEPTKERILVILHQLAKWCGSSEWDNQPQWFDHIIPTTDFFLMNASSKRNLKKKLACVEVHIMIDEISMVSYRYCSETSVKGRLCKIFDDTALDDASDCLMCFVRCQILFFSDTGKMCSVLVR